MTNSIVHIGNNGRKKTYIYKNGVVNTKLVGNLILPNGVTFQDGFIDCNLGGGNYQVSINTEKPFEIKENTILFFEVQEWNSKLAIDIAENKVRYNAPTGTVNRLIMSASFPAMTSAKKLMEWMSAYPSNYSRLKIKKIWFEEVRS